MSHFTTLQTQLRDRGALVRALEELGFRVTVHDTPQLLAGWGGARTGERAEVVVGVDRSRKMSSEMGFALGPDGTYRLLLDDMDRDAFERRWLGPLRKRYAYHVAVEQLTEQGFEFVTRTEEADGTIRLTARRMA